MYQKKAYSWKMLAKLKIWLRLWKPYGFASIPIKKIFRKNWFPLVFEVVLKATFYSVVYEINDAQKYMNNATLLSMC